MSILQRSEGIQSHFGWLCRSSSNFLTDLSNISNTHPLARYTEVRTPFFGSWWLIVLFYHDHWSHCRRCRFHSTTLQELTHIMCLLSCSICWVLSSSPSAVFLTSTKARKTQSPFGIRRKIWNILVSICRHASSSCRTREGRADSGEPLALMLSGDWKTVWLILCTGFWILTNRRATDKIFVQPYTRKRHRERKDSNFVKAGKRRVNINVEIRAEDFSTQKLEI